MDKFRPDTNDASKLVKDHHSYSRELQQAWNDGVMTERARCAGIAREYAKCLFHEWSVVAANTIADKIEGKYVPLDPDDILF